MSTMVSAVAPRRRVSRYSRAEVSRATAKALAVAEAYPEALVLLSHPDPEAW